MRVAFDLRPAGYPLAIIMFLVAPYCVFAGSDWVAGVLAVTGVLLLALLARRRATPARSLGHGDGLTDRARR